MKRTVRPPLAPSTRPARHRRWTSPAIVSGAVLVGFAVVAGLPAGAQNARQSDVPAGAQPYDGNQESYLCEPAGTGAGAFFREISKGIETRREALAEVEATRDELEALKKEIMAETEKLNAAMTAWDEREAEAKKQASVTDAKVAEQVKKERVKSAEAGEIKLAKALAKMPAPSSATVLASLEQRLAARLLKRMPPRQAGATLAALPPVKAAALTTAAIQETP